MRDLARKERLTLPTIPDYCNSNYHLFHVILRNQSERDRVMKKLREEGIQATFHYIPLHCSPYARAAGLGDRELPVTDKLAGSLLRLPLYPGLLESEVDYVVQKLNEALV